MRLDFTRAALLAATSLIALPAYAQENDDILVVTGTRLPSSIERLPADVDVIDIDDAKSRGVSNVADALSEVPGLGVVRGGPFGQQTSLFSGGANSNHTLVLFDGIRLNDPSTPNSSFDAGQDTLGGLTRIEAVQGPMSAVFGSDAIGGVINLLPRRGGPGAINPQLEVAAGSFETLSATAAVDGTLGAFRYAVTAEGFATDGYDIVPERMTTHTGDEDGAESTTLTGVFDFDVTDSFALDLLVRHREARADFDAFNYTMLFEEYRDDDPDLEISRNDLTVARLGATWRLSEALSLRASGGALEQDRAESDNGAVTGTFAGERRFGDLSLDWRAGELGAFSNVGLIAGVETEQEEVDIASLFSSVAADLDRTGAFVTAQGDLSAVTLTGAVRVDDFDGFGTQTTWRLGASLNPTTSTRVYAALGTSFRAPTLYERFLPFYGNPDLEAEEAEAWELGADLRLPAFGQDNGIEFGLIYRQLDVDNMIANAATAPWAYINIDEAEIDSGEARLRVRPTDWLSAQVSYVYTDAQNGVTGAPLLRRPENVWSASLNVERGPFSGQLAWRQVGERYDRLYGDDALFDGIGLTPDYDLLRISAAWTFADSVQVYIAGDNLADETYEVAGGFAGAPANVLVGIRVRP